MTKDITAKMGIKLDGFYENGRIIAIESNRFATILVSRARQIPSVLNMDRLVIAKYEIDTDGEIHLRGFEESYDKASIEREIEYLKKYRT